METADQHLSVMKLKVEVVQQKHLYGCPDNLHYKEVRKLNAKAAERIPFEITGFHLENAGYLIHYERFVTSLFDALTLPSSFSVADASGKTQE